MTYSEFLSRLRRSRRRWCLIEVNPGERWIVTRTHRWQDQHSPLTAIAAKVTGKDYCGKSGRHRQPIFQSEDAGKDLGLDNDTIFHIDCATIEDISFRGKKLPDRVRVRRDLIEATRLTGARPRSRWAYRL